MSDRASTWQKVIDGLPFPCENCGAETANNGFYLNTGPTAIHRYDLPLIVCWECLQSYRVALELGMIEHGKAD